MIVCSCNVFSDNEIRRAMASAVRPPRVSQVYACLGYARQCGRCARTIRKIMHEACAAPVINPAPGQAHRCVPVEGWPLTRL
jgi:bacterioferritin-associated ferredoxin